MERFRGLTLISTSALLIFLFVVLSAVLSIIGKTTPETLAGAIQSEEVKFAVVLSLKCAFAATLLALVIGTPAAYALARHSFRGKELIDCLVDLPVVLPPLISGFGLLVFFGQTGIGKLISGVINFVFTPYGIVLAQFFVATPFVIRTSRAVFESIDVKYEYVAQSLGSSKLESFLRVTLPLARKGILAGATKMKTETLPIAVYLNISVGDIELALAIAFITLLIAVATIFSLKFVVNRC